MSHSICAKLSYFIAFRIESLAINTAFSLLRWMHFFRLARSIRFYVCFVFQLRFSLHCKRSLMMTMALLTLCVHTYVDVSTQVVRHLYTKQSKFDGSRHHTTHSGSQFWFWAPTHRSLVYKLRHIFRPFFMHNTLFRRQNCCPFISFNFDFNWLWVFLWIFR